MLLGSIMVCLSHKISDTLVATVALMAMGAASPVVITAGAIALVGYGLLATANYLNEQ